MSKFANSHTVEAHMHNSFIYFFYFYSAQIFSLKKFKKKEKKSSYKWGTLVSVVRVSYECATPVYSYFFLFYIYTNKRHTYNLYEWKKFI